MSWEKMESRPVSEKLVRCLWFDRHWRPPGLYTLTGQEVIVQDPGRWNVQAGPDFRQAILTFDGGPQQRGDVEVHCLASGWTAHRHHLDTRYNRVILHVCLWNDRQKVDIIRADGQSVPQVVLEAHLLHPLQVYQDAIVLEDYPAKHAPAPGRCYETLRQLAPSAVQHVLEAAGDVRLQQHAARWAGRTADIGYAQVMYEAVMRALGSTGYRQHFQRLARQVPWQELQACLVGVPAADRGEAAEALLLGVAGMWQHASDTLTIMDRETRDYVQKLQEYWGRVPAAIRQRAWHDALWRQPQVRPLNAPQRRLAAMARLLAKYHTTDLLAAALALSRPFREPNRTSVALELCRALTDLFRLPHASYWTRRARLGGQRGKARRLIGSQRTLTMVIDAVLPVLLLWAQGDEHAMLRRRLVACYHAAPLLPDNAVLRYMNKRLLGNDSSLLSLVTGARQQQGLLQIFRDYCDYDEGGCQGCDFPSVSASRNISYPADISRTRCGLPGL